MKKNLFVLLISALATVSLRADLVYKDTFAYTNGQIIVTSTNGTAVNGAPAGSTNWFRHSGTGNDSIVNNGKIEVSATGGSPVSRQDDVHCNFTTAVTNTQTILYSSFIVNCTNLPPAVGTYFAHFFVNSTTFHGRVFAQAPAGVLPGTWRLGIAGAAGTVSKTFPVDLTTNTDYQVVVQWDPVTLFAARIWVNPISSSDPDSGFSADPVTTPGASVGFGFRQGSTFGNFFCTASRLAVATTFEEAQTNCQPTNAVAPLIVRSPSSVTNFAGDAVSLTGLASGQGQASITYLWLKNGAGQVNPNGNSNVLSIPSAVVADSGNYQMVATTPFGLSSTSSVAFLWVTNAPVPPTISPTTNSTVTVFYHQSGSLSVSASGPPPITYAWYYNNGALGPNASGDGTPTLTITDVFTNNQTAGAYYCVASNPFGSKTSGVFTVVASGPPAVSIAYLRTLVDPVNFVVTNSSLRWQATGTVTTFTNLTTGDTSSYYLQDGTAGLNIFVTRGHDFRPPQGASVTFIGFLSSFNSTLELEADTNDVSTSFVINTNADGTIISNALPAPVVIPFSATNNLAQCEYSLEGKTVMLTNVYFGTNAGNTISTNANTPITVTNAAGETFTLLFSSQDLDTAGQVLPAFAYSVIGVFNQNLGNAVVPRNQAYQVEITRFSDIVTNPPPPVTSTVARSGIGSTVTWPNVGWDNVNNSYGSNYSYTVLAPPVSYLAANMSGANEVPANASTAKGFGRVTVSPDGSTLTVNMSFSGLSAAATAAHIHGPAGAGTNASVLFPFSGVPAATSGSIPEQSFALTPAQAGYLAAGLLYMNVHNANFPGGEIRDQLRLPASSFTDKYVVQQNFQANLLGVNEVPATPGTATGVGTVYLSPDQTTITVDFSFSGLSAPATAAHIHGPAGAGTNASVLFPFSGVPSATSGSIPRQSFAITAAQVGFLQAGLLYMNVHNSIYPGGEIRDQIRLVPSTGLTFRNTSLTNTSPTTATYTEKDAGGQKFYRVGSP